MRMCGESSAEHRSAGSAGPSASTLADPTARRQWPSARPGLWGPQGAPPRRGTGTGPAWRTEAQRSLAHGRPLDPRRMGPGPWPALCPEPRLRASTQQRTPGSPSPSTPWTRGRPGGLGLTLLLAHSSPPWCSAGRQAGAKGLKPEARGYRARPGCGCAGQAGGESQALQRAGGSSCSLSAAQGCPLPVRRCLVEKTAPRGGPCTASTAVPWHRVPSWP